MASLELEGIDSTIRNSLHFAKILPNDTSTLPTQIFLARRIFGIASTEIFRPTQTKRENDIAGGAGVESQGFQRFLLGIV